MAMITLSKPLDLLGAAWIPDDPQGDIVAAGPKEIVLVEDNGDTVTFGGTFAFVGGVPVGGSVDSLSEAGAEIGYQATGLAADYADLLPLVQAAAESGDGFPLLAYLLRGADTLIGSGGNDRLVGLDGDDTVVGGSGDDDVNGNTGDDLVHGNSGADFVRGGQGADLVYGGNGDDWHVNGNIGRDTVYGDWGQAPGNDTVFGGQGDDLLYGDFGEYGLPGGDDWLDGNLGNDSVLGEAGRDTILGGAGDDYLSGEEDADSLLGGDGHDTLVGGNGVPGAVDPAPDTLDGGSGDDALIADGGDDLLRGGEGLDLFVLDDSGGTDRIADFAPGIDRLFLAQGLNGLDFDGGSIFAVFSQRLAADGNGGTIIDLGAGNAVILEGVQPGALTAADFYLFAT